MLGFQLPDLPAYGAAAIGRDPSITSRLLAPVRSPVRPDFQVAVPRPLPTARCSCVNWTPSRPLAACLPACLSSVVGRRRVDACRDDCLDRLMQRPPPLQGLHRLGSRGDGAVAVIVPPARATMMAPKTQAARGHRGPGNQAWQGEWGWCSGARGAPKCGRRIRFQTRGPPAAPVARWR
ncbi:hypothetical protein ACCO45_005543 [Purpureocillium lilacinum]|uniref:Uncharacterized protein n=1 Tax=Purpureocillium lilacinum TaxID=33203 RepID=A0ACC4DVZ3_PURLI